MTHTLLHKNLPVAELDFDAATNSIGKITALYHGDHLPEMCIRDSFIHDQL